MTPQMESIDTVWLDDAKIVHMLNVDSPPTLNLKLKISGYDPLISALVDTGANQSFISSQLYYHIGAPEYTIKEQVLKVVGDRQVRSQGILTVDLAIDQAIFQEVSLVILPVEVKTRQQVVLGMDFLSKNKFVVSVPNQMLTFMDADGSQWKIDLNKDKQTIMLCSTRCIATVDILLDSHGPARVPCTWSSFVQRNNLVYFNGEEMSKRLNKRVQGIEGILDMSQDNPAVLVKPASGSSTLIKKGDQIGRVCTVFEIDDNELEMCEPDSWTKLKIGEEIQLSSQLSDVQRDKVQEILWKNRLVLSQSGQDIGCAINTRHHIELDDDTPIYQRPRRLPQPIAEEIESQCKELELLDIIEPSNSPWSSPVVPVRKKDGTTRMCIDYRKLNNVTKSERFPMPNLLDSVYSLAGRRYFTTLDLVKGYYQIPIDEESKEYTAFSTAHNHYQFKRLSFGLKNAPAAFQREMQSILCEFPWKKVLVYIDDVLIVEDNFDKHLALVDKVLHTLGLHGIKIKYQKCRWFEQEVDYLGHRVGVHGISKSKDYTDKVNNIPKPQTVRELRQFLGLINFNKNSYPTVPRSRSPCRAYQEVVGQNA